MPTGDINKLIDAVAEALILADLADAASLAEIERAAAALARAGRRRKAAWAEDASGIAADAASLPQAPDTLKLLEDLGARLGRVQSLAVPRVEIPAVAPEPAPVPAEAAPAASATPLAGDEELLRDFVTRAGEHLEAADEGLLALERDPTDAEALNSVFRAFHTIKGMAGFLALADIEKLSHDTESVLDGPRKGAGPLEPAAFDSVFRAVDAMKKLVAEVLTPMRPQEVSPQAPAAASSSAPTPARAGAVVRVDEERLDRLLDTIGELVIAEAVFSGAALTDIAYAALDAHLGRLDKITRELQEMATSLRMVPLRSTFTRMARLVRDTARKAGKDVEFVTSGEDTELDKMVVDRISDPLIHVLRNAVDHGIENAADRKAARKPVKGRVELRAFHAGGRIHIEISDDGGGLDPQAIASAARERGLLGHDEQPDPRRLLDLICAPGLSTAKTVTDVSGRGVGMDVVRRTIESLRGDVEVDSTPGAGTRIAIRLPLTLAIIDGMVVRVAGERYIVPTLSIERSLRPDASQVSTVLGRGSVVSVDGELVPLVQLGRVFEAEAEAQDPTTGIVVVVSENGDRVGLVAAEILGQQQIVIKSLGEGMRDTQGVAGGAIMPDGQVGLIVDVGGLVKLARS